MPLFIRFGEYPHHLKTGARKVWGAVGLRGVLFGADFRFGRIALGTSDELTQAPKCQPQGYGDAVGLTPAAIFSAYCAAV
jgi:hypothetical protein